MEGVRTKWGEPLVAYADADDEMFPRLKEIVSPSHALPCDLLPGARSVVAYFLPFDEGVAESNIEGREASAAWALAYVDTNRLIADLNAHIGDTLRAAGYDISAAPPTHNYTAERLISDWSHRHVAYIAGLGMFGLNNMLITEKGCCGRLGTFVTDLALEPTKRSDSENCLYKLGAGCAMCVERCVNGALRADGFDRFKCNEMCLLNDKIYSGMAGTMDVCGKCLVGVACSARNPASPVGGRSAE